MDNVTIEVKGTKLILTMDIGAPKLKAAQLSGTGKSRMVASTGGFHTVDEKSGLKVSMNLITKP